MNDFNYARKLEQRRAAIDWASETRYTHAITLNPNRKELSLENLRQMFGQFCLGVDRMMTGKRRASNLYSYERFDAIAFPEHIESNIHLHVAANFAPRYWGARQIGDAEYEELDRIWTAVTAGSGSTDIQLARDAGWAKYSAKEMYRVDHEYFLTSDFHRDDRVVNSDLEKALDELSKFG